MNKKPLKKSQEAVGGWQEMNPTSVESTEVAQNTLNLIFSNRASCQKVITNIYHMSKQVVAGVKYKMEFEACDDNEIPTESAKTGYSNCVTCKVQILEQPWEHPQYQIIEKDCYS